MIQSDSGFETNLDPTPHEVGLSSPAIISKDEETYGSFIEFLDNHGKAKRSEINRVRRLASQDLEQNIPDLLIKLGILSERDTAEALAQSSNSLLVGPEDYPEASPLPETVSTRFLRENHIVGLNLTEEVLTIAVSDPFKTDRLQALKLACGLPIQVCVGLPSDIDKALELQLGQSAKSGLEANGDANYEDGDINPEDVEHLKDLASEAPVIRLVNQIIQRGVEMRASDIHIEPFNQSLKLRYRVDGVLRDGEPPPPRSTAAIISRVKIMAKLNIAERRLPQDGRIRLQIQGQELDLRVSTIPTMFGESVVIRILHKENVKLDFNWLGFDQEAHRQFLEVLQKPHGIILITGPTGSGKSTTLYTALNRINTSDKKIITVEDPVEYQLDGINQIQTKSQIGLTFASTLRSIVRQDPDVIMIGEMRDLETARIAVQSALTGHLVLSTLHTNDAASGITRLMDMGLEDYLICSTVNGILAQRLVRKLCGFCRQSYEPLPELLKEMGLADLIEQNPQFYGPVGCDACDQTGFKGRLAIAEFLSLTDEVRRLVMTHAQAREIHELALSQGMHTMRDDGMRKVAQGLTTLEEVLRVTTEG